jgi:hypothetical protein
MTEEPSKLRGKGLEIGRERESPLKGKGLEIGRPSEHGETSALVGSLAARSIVGVEVEEHTELEPAKQYVVSVKNGDTYEVLADGRAGKGLVRLRNTRNGGIETQFDTILLDPERFIPK